MCTDNSTSGTADTTSTGIALEGKVLTQNGVGVSNVMAKIANSNFSDLTDESGRYSITVTPDSLVTAGVDINSLSDSVQIINESNIVKSLEITNWQDTLPDVFLTQRSISGELLGDVSSIVKIEAVLHNLTDTTTAPQIFNLWFNPLVSSYNSFIYFKSESIATQYSIYIRVYTAEFFVSAISPQLIFPNNAGDIVISPFDVNNVESEIFNMNNVVVSISDTAHLSATITENTSPIIKYEWDIGNMGNYVESPGPTTTFVAPDSTRSIVYILKITDADGGVFQNSSILTVIEDAPQVTITTIDSITSINDSLHFKAHATDYYGTVIKYEWDVGNTSVFVEGPLDGTFIGTSPDLITDSLVTLVRITDDDGITTTNQIVSQIIQDNPIAIITPTTTSFPIKDSIELVGALSSDSLGTIVSYEWKEGYGEWFKGNAIQTISTPQSIDTVYVVSLRVTDDDGNISETSQNIDLIGDTFIDNRDGQSYSIGTRDSVIYMIDALKFSIDTINIGDTNGTALYYTNYDGTLRGNTFRKGYLETISFKPQYLDWENNNLCPEKWEYPSDAKWKNLYYDSSKKILPTYFSIHCVTKNKISRDNISLPDKATITVVTNDVEVKNSDSNSTSYWVKVPYLPNNAQVQSVKWDALVLYINEHEIQERFGDTLIDTASFQRDIEANHISVINIPSSPTINDDNIQKAGTTSDYLTILTVKVTDNLGYTWKKTVQERYWCWWFTDTNSEDGWSCNPGTTFYDVFVTDFLTKDPRLNIEYDL